MNEQIQRALEDLASRGKDPGAATVMQHAREAAPKRRRKQRVRRVAAGIAVVGILGGTAVALRSGSTDAHQVTVATPTTSPRGVSSFSLNPEVSECFSVPSATSTNGAAPSVSDETESSSRLLVLTNRGAIWVLEGSKATLWSGAQEDSQHSTIVWARWLADGSILTARVGNADVKLERFSAPDRSAPLAHLPYTIKAGAPAGSCPIDGYLATFGVVDAGVVVLLHAAGPIPVRSCPRPFPGATPSGCPSPPEGYSIEVRAPQSLATLGRSTGISTGGANLARSEIVSASRASDTIVIDARSENTTLRVGPTNGLCCFGGQSGTAYALSPDGTRLAYAQRPGGRDVSVVAIGPNVPVEELGTPLWNSADPISAMAWTNDTLAAVHGDEVTFIRVPTGAAVGHVTFDTGIRTIDYEHQ